MIHFLNKPKLDIVIDTDLLELFYTGHNPGYVSYKLNDELLNKVLSSFKPEMQEYIEGIFVQTITSSFTNYIHRDPRQYAINYLIDLGGDNVETCFYQQDKTTLIEKYILPLHTWHILKVYNYHCVNNIETKRKAITISFKNHISFDKLLEVVE